MGKGSSPALPAIQTPPAYDPSADAELMTMMTMMSSQQAPEVPKAPELLERQNMDWSAKRRTIQEKLQSGLGDSYQKRTYGNSILTERPRVEEDEESKGLLRN